MKAPSWQIHRASLVHDAFTLLKRQIENEGAPVGSGIEAIAERLNGTPLRTPPGKPEKILKASQGSVQRWWGEWNSHGCKASSLLPKYKSPKKVTCMPDLLIRRIHTIATEKSGGRNKHQKGRDATDIRKQLEREWHQGEDLPGLGTWQEYWHRTHPSIPLPQRPPEFPWTARTVQRHMPPKVLSKMGNIGEAAAKKDHYSMSRDYSKLRKCELYMLDDVRTDFVAMDDITGRMVGIMCYVLMEVASRSIVAFVLKPEKHIKAEDVDELIACGLQAEGYGVGIDYTTHIWFERGTVACSEAAQQVLEALSEGQIKVHRTSMNGGVSWVGAAADRASGHSAGKAAMESFNNKFHKFLSHLPGQRGNTYTNQPANLGVGDKEAKNPSRAKRDTLRAHEERIGQMRATALLNGDSLNLKTQTLLVSEARQRVAQAITEYNAEQGHGMQGFHTFPEGEIAPGIWEPIGEPTQI